MKKKLIRLGEFLCTLCLAAFIVFTCSGEKKSNAPFDSVHKAVAAACDLEGLVKDGVLSIKKQFGLDTEAMTDFVYYHSESVMDVREILIISLDELSLQEDFKEKIKSYVESKQQIFESYAPREEEMLASHILVSKGGYILFYVGNNPQNVAAEFSKAVS